MVKTLRHLIFLAATMIFLHSCSLFKPVASKKVESSKSPFFDHIEVNVSPTPSDPVVVKKERESAIVLDEEVK